MQRRKLFAVAVAGVLATGGLAACGDSPNANKDASKASVDSASAAHKRYWEIFWKQPEIAAEIVNPTQRDLIPMFKSMLAVPMADRKHSQWQFGYPVQFVDRPGMPIR